MQFYQSFSEFLEHLGMRFAGPMWFRFIMQPTVAIVLGIRDGRKDARAGRAPFVWDLIVRPEGRKRQLKRALRSLIKPLIVAIVMDGVVQYLMLQAVYPAATVFVGVMILGVPYSLARGLTNRIASARIKAAEGGTVRP